MEAFTPEVPSETDWVTCIYALTLPTSFILALPPDFMENVATPPPGFGEDVVSPPPGFGDDAVTLPAKLCGSDIPMHKSLPESPTIPKPVPEPESMPESLTVHKPTPEPKPKSMSMTESMPEPESLFMLIQSRLSLGQRSMG